MYHFTQSNNPYGTDSKTESLELREFEQFLQPHIRYLGLTNGKVVELCEFG